MVAHRVNRPFAFPALQDGVVLDINDKTRLMKIEYKDGTKVAIPFGEEYTNNGGGGFWVTQQIAINGWSAGQKFKRGDILAYNDQFFTADPFSKQVDWNIGTEATVALIDNDVTLLDSSAISTELSQKLGFKPVTTKVIQITKGTTIHQYAKIGSHVRNTDYLLTFDEAAIPEELLGDEHDAELTSMLETLNRKTPKAGETGTIVWIDAYYKSLDGMTKSLKGVIDEVSQFKVNRSAYAKSCANAAHYVPPTALQFTERIGNVVMDDDTVLLKFYIQQDVDCAAGDKIIFDSSLKSVVCRVFGENIKTEDHSLEVQAQMSAKSVAARIINSPLLTGIAARCMIKLEEDVLEMYFGTDHASTEGVASLEGLTTGSTPEINQIVSKYMKYYESTDKAHDRKHVVEAMHRARELAQLKGFEDLELAELGALLHDIGNKIERENHELHGATILDADDELRAYLGDNRHARLVIAVLNHGSHSGDPETMLERIVADADHTASAEPGSCLVRSLKYQYHHFPERSLEECITESLNYLVTEHAPTGEVFQSLNFQESKDRLRYVYTTLKALQEITDPVARRAGIDALLKAEGIGFPRKD